MTGGRVGACRHRVRERSTRYLTHGIATIEQCRCGHIRIRWHRLNGARENDGWAEPSAYADLPLLSLSRSKP